MPPLPPTLPEFSADMCILAEGDPPELPIQRLATLAASWFDGDDSLGNAAARGIPPTRAPDAPMGTVGFLPDDSRSARPGHARSHAARTSEAANPHEGYFDADGPCRQIGAEHAGMAVWLRRTAVQPEPGIRVGVVL